MGGTLSEFRIGVDGIILLISDGLIVLLESDVVVNFNRAVDGKLTVEILVVVINNLFELITVDVDSLLDVKLLALEMAVVFNKVELFVKSNLKCGAINVLVIGNLRSVKTFEVVINWVVELFVIFVVVVNGIGEVELLVYNVLAVGAIVVDKILAVKPLEVDVVVVINSVVVKLLLEEETVVVVGSVVNIELPEDKVLVVDIGFVVNGIFIKIVDGIVNVELLALVVDNVVVVKFIAVVEIVVDRIVNVELLALVVDNVVVVKFIAVVEFVVDGIVNVELLEVGVLVLLIDVAVLIVNVEVLSEDVGANDELFEVDVIFVNALEVDIVVVVNTLFIKLVVFFVDIVVIRNWGVVKLLLEEETVVVVGGVVNIELFEDKVLVVDNVFVEFITVVEVVVDGIVNVELPVDVWSVAVVLLVDIVVVVNWGVVKLLLEYGNFVVGDRVINNELLFEAEIDNVLVVIFAELFVEVEFDDTVFVVIYCVDVTNDEFLHGLLIPSPFKCFQSFYWVIFQDNDLSTW